MAKLHFKYGAMNSGKSDTLIKTAFNYEERGLRVLVLKPKIDTKGDSMIVARGGHSRAVDILVDDDTSLIEEVTSRTPPIHCILVDEAQFLSHTHVSELYKLAKQHDISVIAYGLRADFRTKLFPGAHRLFEIADNIEKLPTMCFCGSQAEFNCRKVNGVYVFEGEQVAIEDEQEIIYDSLCGACYIKKGGII